MLAEEGLDDAPLSSVSGARLPSRSRESGEVAAGTPDPGLGRMSGGGGEWVDPT